MIFHGTIPRLSQSGAVTKSNSAALRQTITALPKGQNARSSNVLDPSVIVYSAVPPQTLVQPNQVE